jgi:hypothetical protein
MVTVVAGPLAVIRSARHPRWPISLDEVEENTAGTAAASPGRTGTQPIPSNAR